MAEETIKGFNNITSILVNKFYEDEQEVLACTLKQDEHTIEFEILSEDIHSGKFIYDIRVTLELDDYNANVRAKDWYEVTAKFFSSNKLTEFLGFELTEQNKRDIIKALDIKISEEDPAYLKNEIKKLKDELKELKNE